MGPNCSSCGSSFQVGKGGTPDLASVSTQQWLPGDFQVIKGQIRKELRKTMERNRVKVLREDSRELVGTLSILTSQTVGDLGTAEPQSFRQTLISHAEYQSQE